MRSGLDSRRRLAVVSALLLGSLLSACGSSGESKPDFVARANAICENALRDVRDIAPPAVGGGATSLPSLAPYLHSVTPIVETEVKQLRALPRPSADRAVLGSYMAAIGKSAADYRALDHAARIGDRGAFASALAELRASPAASLAARYGLAECAGSAGTSPAS